MQFFWVTVVLGSRGLLPDVYKEAKREVHTGFWWGDLREDLGNPGVDGRIILKWIFKK
jgi:hypothetical protein